MAHNPQFRFDPRFLRLTGKNDLHMLSLNLGRQFRMRCPSCNIDDLPGKFCLECGSELVVIPSSCLQCGNNNIYGPFCHECGSRIDAKDPCVNCAAPNQSGQYCRVCGEPQPRPSKPKVASRKTKANQASKEDQVSRCSYCGKTRKAYRAYRGNFVLDNRACVECGNSEPFLVKTSGWS